MTSGSVIAGTGHRPKKLHATLHYSWARHEQATIFLRAHLKRLAPASIISGMALGFDQALAEAATDLAIPWVAAIPFEGQEQRWPQASRKLYYGLLGSAERVRVVSQGGYSPQKMHRRNEWMVDRCDSVLTLFDGSPGGTAACLAYAQKMNRPILNLWPLWTTLCREAAL